MMLFLALSMVAGIKTGNASRYGYVGDSYDRVGSFACRRILHARFGERGWQKMRANGVAHRTLPCGTELGVCNPRTGSCTTAYVVDRGPWGALNQKGEWQMRTGRLLPGEHYRGELDLLPGVYTAIGLVGIENVAYWNQHRRRSRLAAAAREVASATSWWAISLCLFLPLWRAYASSGDASVARGRSSSARAQHATSTES